MTINLLNPEECCSFTGHRPNKLPGGYDIMNKLNLELSYHLEKIIYELLQQGVRIFVSGGALGFDWLAFLTVNRIKKANPDKDIKNILAVPFFNQDIKWFPKNREVYNYIKELSDDIIYVDTLKEYKINNLIEGDYYLEKMQLRNQYMVDKSKYLVAYWDGTNGGTKNCVKYAKKHDKNVINIQPAFIESLRGM